MSDWLPGASVHDLHPGIGNGPFGDCYGVVLHVNVDEHGTPDSFWGNGNPGQVCPNFQVYKDGSVHQMLPMNWQPWCQVNGNFHYAAIETAGMPSEPLTDAQVDACARILAAYHSQLGVPLQVTDSPTGRGLACHSTGGQGWGGHACPGDVRAQQRAVIVARAKALGATPHPSPHPNGPPVTPTPPSDFPTSGPLADRWTNPDTGVKRTGAGWIIQIVNLLRQIAQDTAAIRKHLGA